MLDEDVAGRRDSHAEAAPPEDVMGPAQPVMSRVMLPPRPPPPGTSDSAASETHDVIAKDAVAEEADAEQAGVSKRVKARPTKPAAHSSAQVADQRHRTSNPRRPSQTPPPGAVTTTAPLTWAPLPSWDTVLKEQQSHKDSTNKKGHSGAAAAASSVQPTSTHAPIQSRRLSGRSIRAPAAPAAG